MFGQMARFKGLALTASWVSLAEQNCRNLACLYGDLTPSAVTLLAASLVRSSIKSILPT